MSAAAESARPLGLAGKAFVAIAVVEAVTWAALLVGMGLKYGVGTRAHGVWILGWLHGAAFLAYLATCFLAGARLRWSLWRLLLAVLAERMAPEPNAIGCRLRQGRDRARAAQRPSRMRREFLAIRRCTAKSGRCLNIRRVSL